MEAIVIVQLFFTSLKHLHMCLGERAKKAQKMFFSYITTTAGTGPTATKALKRLWRLCMASD